MIKYCIYGIQIANIVASIFSISLDSIIKPNKIIIIIFQMYIFKIVFLVS